MGSDMEKVILNIIVVLSMKENFETIRNVDLVDKLTMME